MVLSPSYSNLASSVDLTPIRIRGKKRAKAREPVEDDDASGGRSMKRKALSHRDVRRSTTSTTVERPTRIFGYRNFKAKVRPSSFSMSRSATPASVTSGMSFCQHHTRTSTQQQRPRNKPGDGGGDGLAQLETLPAELLEQIFLYDCNLSLLRSSLIISAKLSHPHVYRRFCTRIFCQLSCSRSRDVWRVVHGLDESDEELTQMRMHALKYQWMSWKLFKEVREDVLEREGRRLQNEVFSGGSTAHDRRFHTDGLKLWFGLRIRVPSKLLKWPCKGDNFEFLRACVQSGATVDELSLDYEIMRETWLKAVKDRDYRLIHILSQPGLFNMPDMTSIDRAIQYAKGDLAMRKMICRTLEIYAGPFYAPGEYDYEDLMDKIYYVDEKKWLEEQRLFEREKLGRTLDDDDIDGEEKPPFIDHSRAWGERYPDDKDWQSAILEMNV